MPHRSSLTKRSLLVLDGEPEEDPQLQTAPPELWMLVSLMLCPAAPLEIPSRAILTGNLSSSNLEAQGRGPGKPSVPGHRNPEVALPAARQTARPMPHRCERPATSTAHQLTGCPRSWLARDISAWVPARIADLGQGRHTIQDTWLRWRYTATPSLTPAASNGSNGTKTVFGMFKPKPDIRSKSVKNPGFLPNVADCPARPSRGHRPTPSRALPAAAATTSDASDPKQPQTTRETADTLDRCHA